MAVKDPGYSPFIQAVAGDGTSPPDVRLLTGWLGASGEEGSVRLYLDATLSAYVDIPRDAVLYSEEIPNSHPSGQRSVWVKNDAELKEGGSAIARASKFLFGQVQQDFGGGAQAAGAPPQVQQTQICLTFKPGCQQPQRFTRIPCSAIDACPSALIECQQTSPPCITAAPCTCPGPVTVRWPDCGSAVDACPTRICAQPEVAQQQVGGPGFATRFCTPPPLTPACPATVFGCPTAGFCPPRTAGCPPPSAFCPTRFNCPVPSQFQCPSFGRCPSAVDACPSALGCTFACNVNFDWTIVQQTPVLQQQQPQFDTQQFAQQQVGGPSPSMVGCTRFPVCPPATSNWGCPSSLRPCPSWGFCPTNVICGPAPQFNQQRFVQQQFGQQQVAAPPITLDCTRVPPCLDATFSWGCPSSLRPCPSWGFCPTNVICGPFDANVFGGGGFVGAGGKTVVLPGPGTSQFCVTADCQTPIIACPDPNPSVARPCSTAIPALCPDVRQPFAAGITGICQPTAFCHVSAHQCGGGAQAFDQQSTDFCPTALGCGGQAAAISGGPCVTQSPCTCHGGGDAAVAASGPGWTCMCPPQNTRYPQCPHSAVGPVCVTRPPCF